MCFDHVTEELSQLVFQFSESLYYDAYCSIIVLEMFEISCRTVLFHFSSYLHCEWRTAYELELGDKRVHQKIKRFRAKQLEGALIAGVRHMNHYLI